MNYINAGKRDILIFPSFKGIEKIQTIRNKYDELANIIPPHITLAFPFDLPISNEKLKEELGQILSKYEKIDITCEGISFIKDEIINKYYIFLNITEGNETIKNINKDIYEKVLKIPKSSNYIPHITLGTVNEIDANITLNETFETTIENIIVESIGKNEESTFACIDSFEKAKFWEEMGADYICVDFVKINRDFKTLKYMVDNLKKSKIELLMTNSCLKNCPYIHTHTAALSHASNSVNEEKTNYADWCLYKCQEYQLRHLEEYVKSPWIRPEDVKEYENIGIEHFKITERDFPTEELVKRVKAYSERKYNGNLLDLIQGHGCSNSTKELIMNYDDIDKMSKEEIIEEIARVRGLGKERECPRHIYIDNQKLDGFIEIFKKGNCTGNCLNCNYCKRISDKVITRNDQVCDYLIKLYNQFNKIKF